MIPPFGETNRFPMMYTSKRLPSDAVNAGRCAAQADTPPVIQNAKQTNQKKSGGFSK